MKSISKALVGTVAIGAMALSSATPAFAQERHRDRGIDAGDVIAGALIIGGIAALASAIDDDHRDRDYRYDDRNDRRDRRYSGRGHAQQVVEQCVNAAERRAERISGSRADVFEIRDVDRQRGGFEIRGRIAVQDRSYRGGRNDYRRDYRNAGWDEGRFTCEIQRGRVVDVDFNGIRSLRRA